MNTCSDKQMLELPTDPCKTYQPQRVLVGKTKPKHLERKYIQLHDKYTRMPDKNSDIGKRWALKLNEMYKKLKQLS